MQLRKYLDQVLLQTDGARSVLAILIGVCAIVFQNCTNFSGNNFGTLDFPADGQCVDCSSSGSKNFQIFLNSQVNPQDDASQPGTEDKPVLTLGRANEILEMWKLGSLARTDIPSYPSNVEIIISLGYYYDHPHVTWTFTMPKVSSGSPYTITIRSQDETGAQKPEFNGCSQEGCTSYDLSLFQSLDSNGQPNPNYEPDLFHAEMRPLGDLSEANFVFKNLRIKNYTGAIRVLWNKNATSRNIIDGCEFENIGSRLNQNNNLYDSLDSNNAVSAISIWGSSNNTVSNNSFTNIIRTGDTSSTERLHALYFYHSNSNLIQGNVFTKVSGIAVDMRNGSSYNKVIGNIFDQASGELGVYPVPISFVSAYLAGECPSYGNVFEQNTIGQTYPLPPSSTNVTCKNVPLATVGGVNGVGGVYQMPSDARFKPGGVDICGNPLPSAVVSSSNIRLIPVSPCAPIPMP